MTLTDRINDILKAQNLAEAYPGMGRNQETESPMQGGSVKPPVETLNKGVQGGSTQNTSSAKLAAGAGPMDKKPPKQGDSQDASTEELDPNAPGTTAGKKSKKMPVPTATGAGAARNFADAVDPVSAVTKRSTQGNIHQESAEDLESVEEVEDEDALDDSVDYAEEIASLFAGEEDLSEDFKVRAASLFAALVEARVSYEVEQLEEAFAQEAAELVEARVAEITEAVDAYLNEVVETFVEENSLEFQQNARTEIAENFMESLRDLFAEHYIEVPEGRENVLDEMAERLEQVEAELQEMAEVAEQAILESREAEKQIAFLQITEGLTDMDREKLSRLVENVDFEDTDSFAEKVSIIAENYLAGKGGNTSSALTEEFGDDESIQQDHDAAVLRAAAEISRSLGASRL
jgi:phage host-nuclease inhibitor protein Gam